MTTPEDPDAAARMRANAFIRDGEARISRRWFGSMTRWLDRVRPQVLPPDSGDAVSPQNVAQNAAYWGQLMDSEVLPEVQGLMSRVFRRVAGDQPVTPAFEADYLNAAGNRLRNVPNEVYARIVREIETGIAEGESIPDISSRVRTLLTASGTNLWPNRATTVARTESLSAINAGAYAGAVQDAEDRGDVAPMKVWLATSDNRVRPTHKAADKQRTLLTSPFVVGGAQLLFPGDPRGPANEVINCFPGDVRVSVPSDLVRIYRRWYQGPMLRIQMEDGVQLPVTPNHPLLTESGWQAAQSVKAGDKLCGAVRVPRVGAGQPDIEDAPSTFHELYRASMQSGVSGRVVGSAVDFHSDGSDAEVEVVLPHRVLGNAVDASVGEGLTDQKFVGLHDGEGALPMLCGTECGGHSADGSELRSGVLPEGRVGCLRECLPLLGSGVGHADVHGLTAPPDDQAQVSQPADDDGAANPEVVRHALDRLPGGMALRQVVKVDRYSFTGHVYNLESVGGWYIANDTASHNCRCSLLPVVLGETIDWTDRQRA